MNRPTIWTFDPSSGSSVFFEKHQKPLWWFPTIEFSWIALSDESSRLPVAGSTIIGAITQPIFTSATNGWRDRKRSGANNRSGLRIRKTIFDGTSPGRKRSRHSRGEKCWRVFNASKNLNRLPARSSFVFYLQSEAAGLLYRPAT